MPKKAKILIVEDNVDVADGIAERLTGLGYNVCATIPADFQAVNTAVAMAPDLALIDVGHQETMNGVDIAKNIYDRLGIPIIYLTGYVNEALLKHVKITRAFGHVYKPYDTNQLLLSIENHLFWHEEDRRLADRERGRTTILNSLGEAVIATNKNGLVTFMNPVAEQLTGWSQKEASGRELEQVFRIKVDGDENLARRMLEDAIEDGHIFSRIDHSTSLICKDGKTTLIDFTAAPVTDEHEGTLGVTLVFRDTSKLKATEDELAQTIDKLQKQTQLMETVFDSISDGVVATDEAGNFLLVNPSAEEIVGIGPTDASPGEWSERYGTFYPDGVTPFPASELPLVHAMQGKETDGVDLVQKNPVRPEGVYINVSGRPLLEKEGGVRGGVIIFRNVTKLKKAEMHLEQTIEKLESQTQFMESIFEHISDGVIVVNENAEIKIFNPSAEKNPGLQTHGQSPRKLDAR